MNSELYDKGLGIRRKVVGEEYVNKSLEQADEFSSDFQTLVTEYCWGAVWGRETLDHKTRSMLNIAMIAALNRPHELRLHVHGALRNGVTQEEIREILLQVTIYAGVPAGVDSFRIAREAMESFTPDS
jgi:4-carboxymuconolactone decarboxylase